MLSATLRKAFLSYFQSKAHTLVPSSPVIPHDDPSLLFINAGMNQFKDVFLGKTQRDYNRATSSQKCIRVGGKHNDLENVGHTTRHLTFFEMLGNFSFGDYFKEEAIDFAWEVTTTVFALDPKRIWVSVYKDDDTSFSIWEKHLPADRIVRFGDKENFWTMGDVGPCGPCTELLYDRGNLYGNSKNPYEDHLGERFFEFWNLVFMQQNRLSDGTSVLLPKQSVDAGAGLERIVSLKMDAGTVFETDILRSLIREVENLCHQKYEPNSPLAPAFHVISDHIRALSFAIADGVTPSNTDRGYILRKILRRAVRYGRTLGLKKPFLGQVLPSLVSLMGEDFPELKKGKERIEEILTLEEEGFLKTLERGGNLLGQVIASSKGTISGDDAFKLKDTYGFPLEEIELLAKDERLMVDLPRFYALEEQARETSRKAQKKTAQTYDENLFNDFISEKKPCEFVGYSKHTTEATIVGILVDGAFAETLEGSGAILLDKTSFYAEMGGQVGDTGMISSGKGSFQVDDTSSPFSGVIVHQGNVNEGSFKIGDRVSVAIDQRRRQKIANNHTATHLLHLSLQEILGPHIQQAGSLVEEEKLRFDFNHHKSLSREEIIQIEQRVNELIRQATSVQTYELSLAEAQKRRDIKQFFGDKYGESVRVVDIGESKELCGGTHTDSIGMIGLFKIGKESSIAAGVRRIEAMTGSDAEMLVLEEEKILGEAATLLKTVPQNLIEKITHLQGENKRFLSQIKEMRKKELLELTEKILLSEEKLGNISFISQIVPLEPEEMSGFAQNLLKRLSSAVVALGAETEGRALLFVAVSNDLVKKKIEAGSLIKGAAPFIEGGGGGRPNIAQAGGTNPRGFPMAFENIKSSIQC